MHPKGREGAIQRMANLLEARRLPVVNRGFVPPGPGTRANPCQALMFFCPYQGRWIVLG